MVRFSKFPVMLCLSAALAVSAQAQPSATEATLPPIATSAASPPVATLAEVQNHPLYKTSWEQFLALKAKAHPPRPGNWSGVWANESPFAWEPGYPFTKFRLPASAPLKPEYRKRYDKLYDNYVAGIDYDTLSDCVPPGWPRLLVESDVEFGIQPEQTLMYFALENEVRTIRTNGESHVAEDDAVLGWEGDSIGFWDGDTLIIHTNHVRGLPMSYERNGPPTSDQVTGVEQWRKIDDQHLRLQVTIYDPEVLTAPWRPAPRVYEKIMPPNTPLLDHYMCFKDVVRNAKGGTDLLVPGNPDFIDTDVLIDRAKKEVDQVSR